MYNFYYYVDRWFMYILFALTYASNLEEESCHDTG